MKNTINEITTVETTALATKTINHLAELRTQIAELKRREDNAKEVLRNHVGFIEGAVAEYRITRNGSVIASISTIEAEKFELIDFRDKHPGLAVKFTGTVTKTTIKTL